MRKTNPKSKKSVPVERREEDDHGRRDDDTRVRLKNRDLEIDGKRLLNANLQLIDILHRLTTQKFVRADE